MQQDDFARESLGAMPPRLRGVTVREPETPHLPARFVEAPTFLKLTLSEVHERLVPEALGESGLKLDRPAVARERLFPAPHTGECHTTAAMRLGSLPVHLHRGVGARQRLFVPMQAPEYIGAVH